MFSSKLLAGSAIIVTAAALTIAAASPLNAQDSEEEDSGPGSGVLMLTARGAETATPAIQLGTDMDVTVSGTVARVRVTQAFRNTSTRWVEARYVYPLPQDGAVDSLKMVVGQRVIVGRIKPREVAEKIYEKAKDNGQRAGLVEEQRPNMFVNRVANVGPGETVLIAIEYQAPVRQVAGQFSLRLPLVVGPRYTPPHTLNSPNKVADAEVVTSSPIALKGNLNPVSINVNLAPGFAPSAITSPYHRISVQGSGIQRSIHLANGTAPADRDFELTWRAATSEPAVGLFRQRVDGRDYLMASLVPPVIQGAPVPPREMVFVIDNSGSMGGESMDEAKASLEHALRTLRPQDHFNVIRFDDSMTKLFDSSVQATPDQVRTAIQFARSLEAEGGTEMLPALKAALADAAATGGPNMLRQIIFLTDGDISNEEEMAAAIAADSGKSQVFPVGIGSAPNNYLMARMAAMGGGTYTNIGDGSEVNSKMTALLDALSRPALQDVRVTVSGSPLDLTPKSLPDVYAGQSLVLLGRTDHLKGKMTVSGQLNGQRWSSTLDLANAIESPAVSKMWARRRIDEVETDATLTTISYEQADNEIEKLGMEHSIVTRRTSLVAVDETPARKANEPLTREEVPINLPAGWNWDDLLGGDAARTALANEAAAKSQPQDMAEAVELPETALNFATPLRNGLVLMFLGLAGLWWSRRRRSSAR